MNKEDNLVRADDVAIKPRPRGRPRTGTAQTGAARQAKYRQKQRNINVTVTINRRLLEKLDAQLLSIRDGSSVQILTCNEASELLLCVRGASLIQLPSLEDATIE